MNPKMPLVSTYSPVQFSLAAGVSGGNAVSGNSSTCRAGRGPLLSRSFRVSTQVHIAARRVRAQSDFPRVDTLLGGAPEQPPHRNFEIVERAVGVTVAVQLDQRARRGGRRPGGEVPRPTE